ncbi:MAG TPA: DoxX family protein [Burkholderiales bacterium]
MDRAPVATANDLALLIGRVAIAALYLPSGFSKLVNLPGFIDQVDGRGVPLAPLLAPLGAAIEFLAGLALLLGVQVRLAAVLLLVFTAAATLIAHRFWEYQGAAQRMQQINFFKNVAIAGGFVFLAAHGGGRWCLENLWRRDRRQRPAGRRATDRDRVSAQAPI